MIKAWSDDTWSDNVWSDDAWDDFLYWQQQDKKLKNYLN